jgi:hypothetical protein
MNNLSLSNNKDLYLDESGYNYIGQSKYRFFLLSATVIESSDKELANLLFMKWRAKHLRNANKCFHASQFFEDRKGEIFKKSELSITRNFNNSVKELMELISYIKFSSKVFYVDLPELRKKLKLPDPPTESNYLEQNRKKDYSRQKKKYSAVIKETLGEDKRYLPLVLALHRCFDYHNNLLSNIDKGYINMESQSNSDVKFIKIFHSYKDKDKDKKYDKRIVGLNLHTKSSLDSGIELSDLITYIACQTLRSRFRLKNELKHIADNRMLIIKHIRYILRSAGVSIIDVTSDPIRYKKS